MTTHELAQELLKAPELPVVVFDRYNVLWREVVKVEDYMTHRYKDTHGHMQAPTQIVPISILPITHGILEHKEND